MPTLTERKAWKKQRPERYAERVDRLTSEEETNVRAAMRVLRIRCPKIDLRGNYDCRSRGA